MFARRYFCSPGFAPRYFPPVGFGVPPEEGNPDAGDEVGLICAFRPVVTNDHEIRTRVIGISSIRTSVHTFEER